MIHIPLETGQRNQRDMDHDEADEPDQNQEVNRERALSAAEDPCISRKAIDQCRRHRHAGKDRQRSHDEDGSEVSQLLQGVVAIKAVRLGWKVEVGVEHEGIPRLHEDGRRSGDKPFPLRTRQ